MPKRGRKPKKGPLCLEEKTVAHGVTAIFGTVAYLTRHKHWTKRTDQVSLISEPLTNLLNSLPESVLERFERHADLAMLTYGLMVVAGPDLMIEMEMRKLAKQGWAPARVPQPGGLLGASPQMNGAAPSNTENGASSVESPGDTLAAAVGDAL